MGTPSLEQRIDVLERQVRSLRRQHSFLYGWFATVSSPLHHRLWWYVGGYRFTQVGRWYTKDCWFFRRWLWVENNICGRP